MPTYVAAIGSIFPFHFILLKRGDKINGRYLIGSTKVICVSQIDTESNGNRVLTSVMETRLKCERRSGFALEYRRDVCITGIKSCAV